MQQNQTTDSIVDSTTQRLPYAAPTLEELSSAATAGVKGSTRGEHVTTGS